MALWSNTDANTSAPKHTVDVVSGNTGVQAYGLTTTGTFAVDTNEAQASGHINGHAGWVLRKVGSGGRAGRVFQETLVAMGSIGTDGSDDTQYPDYTIRIVTQPLSSTQASGNSVTLSVVAASTPETTLGYQWYRGSTLISGATNATLNAGVQTTSNTYYVEVSATGASTVTSANAVITVA